MADTALPDISDTARWVAVYRALETQRPDGLFRDAFASRLAGERGREIAEGMPRALRRNPWPLVMRTKLMDELILKSASEGADLVLNLAAGLDTRPYRLALPSSLSWVEADLPALLAEKEKALAGEKPNCQLRRERVDLADASARGAFLGRELTAAKRALVITEGLLVYLEPKEVRALASDLGSRNAVAWWILDIASPSILRMMQKGTGPRLGASAQMKFGPADGVRFFESSGWRPLEVHSLFHEAARLKRLPTLLRLLAWLPQPDPTSPGNKPWSAVVRFARGQ
jgi:methyltransferase (TIGR00027 family)